jgi:hypothetical protein
MATSLLETGLPCVGTAMSAAGSGACGLGSGFIEAVGEHRLGMRRGPAASLPRKSQFLRLCKAPHNRNNWQFLGRADQLLKLRKL